MGQANQLSCSTCGFYHARGFSRAELLLWSSARVTWLVGDWYVLSPICVSILCGRCVSFATQHQRIGGFKSAETPALARKEGGVSPSPLTTLVTTHRRQVQLGQRQ